MSHVIVVGNEKGGAGKSTVAMHLTMALLMMKQRVSVIDLDIRQASLSRYLANRRRYRAAKAHELPMPFEIRVPESEAANRQEAAADDTRRLREQIDQLVLRSDFVVIDSPGGHTALARAAHVRADTLITPMNDSFVDFDLLGEMDDQFPDTVRPSLYAEMVWSCRREKAQELRTSMDWVVMRNRISPLDARNKHKVGEALKALSNRIGFRIAPGLSERVIFRELFPLGLTLLDDTGDQPATTLTMSHVAARQELRDMLIVLKLPGLEGVPISF